MLMANQGPMVVNPASVQVGEDRSAQGVRSGDFDSLCSAARGGTEELEAFLAARTRRVRSEKSRKADLRFGRQRIGESPRGRALPAAGEDRRCSCALSRRRSSDQRSARWPARLHDHDRAVRAWAASGTTSSRRSPPHRAKRVRQLCGDTDDRGERMAGLFGRRLVRLCRSEGDACLPIVATTARRHRQGDQQRRRCASASRQREPSRSETNPASSAAMMERESAMWANVIKRGWDQDRLTMRVLNFEPDTHARVLFSTRWCMQILC